MRWGAAVERWAGARWAGWDTLGRAAALPSCHGTCASRSSNLAAASWRLPDGDFQALSSLPFQRRRVHAGQHSQLPHLLLLPTWHPQA